MYQRTLSRIFPEPIKNRVMPLGIAASLAWYVFRMESFFILVDRVWQSFAWIGIIFAALCLVDAIIVASMLRKGEDVSRMDIQAMQRTMTKYNPDDPIGHECIIIDVAQRYKLTRTIVAAYIALTLINHALAWLMNKVGQPYTTTIVDRLGAIFGFYDATMLNAVLCWGLLVFSMLLQPLWLLRGKTVVQVLATEPVSRFVAHRA